ncbi:hypothetical protein SAMN05444166_0302 [Singulisphaera sp. GP187]|uniref:hypothetical protein n=1 Tax=Singulisphaera sp. GP187 TaxID=1882752 RepID=UPI000926E03D|nr:hypothetical protein [Singulisphaera sp. GP187]SIN70881.1 hypothetical protein SAMN05444166_0302 [Singulisphaera sp. GP187]
MKSVILNALTLFGLLSVFAWLGLAVGVWRLTRDRGHDPPSPPHLGREPIAVSPVAERIAAKFAPALQTLATENKEGVVAASGNVVSRLAVRTIYPAGVKAIPYATQIGCDRALSYLDGLSVSQLVGMMTEHARAKGHRVHPSVARQAGVP